MKYKWSGMEMALSKTEFKHVDKIYAWLLLSDKVETKNYVIFINLLKKPQTVSTIFCKWYFIFTLLVLKEMRHNYWNFFFKIITFSKICKGN